ncbi:MAG: M24 family metallopeptidase [Ignavibacteria bacterium]|nr:M24 family metallopeptidase [Bacteroidota bacterium]MSQ45502.1 M24 family metallopeptidase [Ignavibacteria bacterium]
MKKIFLAFFLISSTIIAQDIPYFTTDFSPEEFATRREKMYESIGPNSVALIQGAQVPNNYTRFRQSNEFYYLCGIETPHSYLILDGSRKSASLYLPHGILSREMFEGKMLTAEDADEVKQLSGINNVYSIDMLNEHLSRFSRGNIISTVYTPFSPAEGFAMGRDLAVRAIADAAMDPFDGHPSREGILIQKLKEKYPALEVKNFTPFLDQARLIKSEKEIEMIDKATRLSCLALLEGMKSTVPGIYEHELDGMAKYIYYRNGSQGEAYYSLIAGGTNAWYPHYAAGKKKLVNGEMLLFDFAPDYGYYASDITRNYPVNGKFNQWQKELYGFYVGCYKAILNKIRPGETAQKIMQEAAAEMEIILSKSKFSKPIYENAAKEFVSSYKNSAKNQYASLGHWVGMSVHDVGFDKGPLKPGMVFSIEPALRVPEEKIYIRLEDVIVITETGKKVLSDFLPMEIDEIEKIMKEDGMLQKYPKDEFNRLK